MKSAAANLERSTLIQIASAAPTKRRPLRWFIAAPARMALDPGLSHAAFRLATVLMHYEGEQGCFPSQQRLAEHLGISLDSVQRYLRELELYGFLIRERRYRKTNRYTLAPVYEAPIAYGSLEATGSLEIENDEPRRPPSPRTLRQSKAKSQTVPPAAVVAPSSLHEARRARSSSSSQAQEEDAAPVRPLTSLPDAVTAPSVRSLVRSGPPEIAAPVRPPNAAPVRYNEPHECGPINTVPIQDSPQQDSPASNESGVDNQFNDGLLSLRSVGVNLAANEIGVHLGSGLSLRNEELRDWARWVSDGPSHGIRNKSAFCATKIRLGFAIDDVFPAIANKRRADAQRSDQERLTAREHEVDREATDRADQAISAMTREERVLLRKRALDDGGVWLARDLSPELLARVILAAERRIAIGVLPVSETRRDHRLYKALPPL